MRNQFSSVRVDAASGHSPVVVRAQSRLFLLAAPGEDKRAPNTAAVTMSCLGARFGAVRAINDTN